MTPYQMTGFFFFLEKNWGMGKTLMVSPAISYSACRRLIHKLQLSPLTDNAFSANQARLFGLGYLKRPHNFNTAQQINRCDIQKIAMAYREIWFESSFSWISDVWYAVDLLHTG